MHTDFEPSRPRSIAGAILLSLVALALFGGAIAKLAHVPKVVSELGALGFYGSRLTAIALLEIASALLFVLQPTRSLGLLLASAYLGGAIATHVGHGSPWFQPALVLSLLWLGTYLRHPVILWSFDPSPSGARAAASARVQEA